MFILRSPDLDAIVSMQDDKMKQIMVASSQLTKLHFLIKLKQINTEQKGDA